MARPTRRKARPAGKTPRRKRRGRKGNRRWLRRALLWLSLTAVLAGGGYLFWIDLWVQREFDGRRWALPARVYARPMELYVGARISQPELIGHLERLGYARQRTADRPGTFAASGDEVALYRRAFRFWDSVEPQVSARVQFNQAGVAALTGDSAPLDLLRLDAALIGSFYPESDEDRVLLRLQEVPPVLVEALIAVEDRAYWQHPGISVRGIGRALLADIRAGKAVQGGSTLTQQLVKNFFLTPERSISRKLQEALMALLLERHYSKEEILETYLNEVFLGQVGKRSVHGFAQASWLYFGRPLQELHTGQLALLAGMVKAPSAYNPRRNPRQAAERRDLVLEVMVREGVLSAETAAAAKTQDMQVSARTPVGANRYPHFLDLVRRQLRRDYPDNVLREEGLRLFTTLDAEAQDELRATLAGEGSAKLAPEMQSAAIVVEVATGEVLAMAGGRDPRAGGFNRALDAARPIGSLVKPAVYLAALEQPQRFHLASPIPDEPLEVNLDNGDVWVPQNADKAYRGSVPLMTGLVNSLNIPTVNLGLAVGTEQVADTLRRLGITRHVQTHPSLLLGALELAPIEVAQMYLTLAGNGFHTPLRAIRSVTDHSGEPVSRYPLRVEQTVASAPAFLINILLQEVVSQGTARGLGATFPGELGLAGKTGTSDDTRDAWFAGYAGNLLTVVWVGRDDNAPTGLHGASGALPLWADFMARRALHPFTPSQPEAIVWVEQTPGVTYGARNCSGRSSVPMTAEYLPLGMVPCGQDDTGNGAVTRPLRWLRNLFD